MKLWCIQKLEEYRGIWPWIAESSGVSHSYITSLMQGQRKRLYIDTLQKLCDTLVDIENGDLPIPTAEFDKLQSGLGQKRPAA